MRRFGAECLETLKSLLSARDPRAPLSAPYRIVTLAASSMSCAFASHILLIADFSKPGDGLCAIDVTQRVNHDHDTASNHDISVAAKSILDQCVFREIRRGGPIPIGGAFRYLGSWIILSLSKVT